MSAPPFYRAFEDRYRGERAVIKDRLRAYAPFVLPLAAPGAGALDLGCGRGEWLELLGEYGFAARGVDLDDAMLAACRERGLDVETGDALAALRACPDASLALVSAFHLVEHIDYDLVRALAAEALRALRPGGLLVLETPNPENLVVGASSFYMDPSHLRPIPPALLAFTAEHAGFARHKVVRLQEAPELHTDPRLALINVLEGPSPDYGVVAQKAAPAALLAPFEAAFAADYGLALAPLAARYEAQLAERERTLHLAVARLDGEDRALALTLARARADADAADAALAREHADAAARLARLEHEQGLLAQGLQAAEARAAAHARHVEELLASTSWRVTAPLRALGEARLRARAGLRRRLRAAVLGAGRAVLRAPRAKRLARALLRPFPGLQARLYALVLRADAAPAAVFDDPAPGQLSPRAARILAELQQLHHTRNR